MKVIYTGEEPPKTISGSIFLAGPSPRGKQEGIWREDALDLLRKLGFEGTVFNPEYREGKAPEGMDYDGQVDWEKDCLNLADVVVFWVPRDIEGGYLALTTNVEFGFWVRSGKALLGAPPSADKTRYLEWLGKDNDVPVYDTLEFVLDKAVEIIGDGAQRTGGARHVPLFIWRTKMFQDWYKAQISAGNRLDDARVEWKFILKDKVFSWILWVNVWIGSEGRHKSNEFVFARTDIACVVLYLPNQDDLPDSQVVLVREYRSPARNADCFVHEVPGGSIDDDEPKEAALREVEEETGIKLPADRAKLLGSRQLASTLSAHHAHVWAINLTVDEMEKAIELASNPRTYDENEGERTYVEVLTVSEMLESDLVDWSNLGMIFAALMG
jgi:8-oxo-dGTP pyrophosphatase MutT (NUDIX family)